MLSDAPRLKLCELIKIYGPDLCADTGRCIGLLKDHCSGYKAEVSVLQAALETGVAAELRNALTGTPPEVLLGWLERRLQDDRALAEDAARWSVESWALALGVIANPRITPVLQTPLQVSVGPSTTPSAGQVQLTPDSGSSKAGTDLWKIAFGVMLAVAVAVGGIALFRQPPSDVPTKPSAEEVTRIAPEQQARIAAEQQARIAAEQQARIAAEQQARIAAEQQARIAAEQQARVAAEQQARVAAEQQARIAAEQQARVAAEQQARLATEQAARQAAEQNAQLIAEQQTRLLAEQEARIAADRQAKQASLQAQNVVRAYYQDLHNNDCRSARLKHLLPPAKLCDLIKRVEWFRVDALAPISASPSEAIIGVDVTGKNYGEQPRKWAGRFTLKRIDGDWKIVTMNLSEVK